MLLGCGSDDTRISTGVDLQVDRAATVTTLQVSEEEFAADDCAVIEGAVAAPGRRRLLRFDTVVVNRGDEDLVVGDLTNPEPPFTAADFEFSPVSWALPLPRVRDVRAPAIATIIWSASGTSRASHDRLAALLSGSARAASTVTSRASPSGGATSYASDLDGQWVDVTGVPAGDYVLIVTVNLEGKLPEVASGAPNVVRIPVQVAEGHHLLRCSLTHLCGVAPLRLRVRSVAPRIWPFLSNLQGLPRVRGGASLRSRPPVFYIFVGSSNGFEIESGAKRPLHLAHEAPRAGCSKGSDARREERARRHSGAMPHKRTTEQRSRWPFFSNLLSG